MNLDQGYQGLDLHVDIRVPPPQCKIYHKGLDTQVVEITSHSMKYHKFWLHTDKSLNTFKIYIHRYEYMLNNHVHNILIHSMQYYYILLSLKTHKNSIYKMQKDSLIIILYSFYSMKIKLLQEYVFISY